MKALQQIVKCIVAFSVLSVLTMAFVTRLEANDIVYMGVTKCGGRQVEVSFIYDSTSSIIKNFKAIHACVEELNNGEGIVTTKIDKPFAVKDNKFSIHSIVEGVISSAGKSRGKILGQMQYMKSRCSDNKMYDNCTDWVAEPQK
jgi:hypothetical protein